MYIRWIYANSQWIGFSLLLVIKVVIVRKTHEYTPIHNELGLNLLNISERQTHIFQYTLYSFSTNILPICLYAGSKRHIYYMTIYYSYIPLYNIKSVFGNKSLLMSQIYFNIWIFYIYIISYFILLPSIFKYYLYSLNILLNIYTYT
jgi:hypothetical protein